MTYDRMLALRRNFLMKLLLISILVFLVVQLLKFGSSSDIVRELQQSGRLVAALGETDNENENNSVDRDRDQEQVRVEKNVQEPLKESQINEEILKQEIVVKTTAAPIVPTTEPPTVEERVRQITQCHDKQQISRTQQRGDYWVLYNYIKAEKRHKCHESVTYTTHADYTFLDNLLPLLERWRGPISIALHAPGTDFQNTLDSIYYLRDCTSPLVKEFVTFHIYFSTKHVPKKVPRHDRLPSEPRNCSLSVPFLNSSSEKTYKSQKKLLYPVNVGRNIARESALTHYIFPSDIELYPSLNLISDFLAMIAENSDGLKRPNPKVFPVPLFEVPSNQVVPETKTQLKEMLLNGTAFPFHKKLCPGCHNIPKFKEWQVANESDGLHVFHIGKRTGYFVHWEPIFIGTHADPLYDERLSWEGKSDKMTQGYALCVLDYDFLILDNAFLVHKPGIKVYKKDHKRATLAAKTNQLIKKIIFPELRVLYGYKPGCAV